MKPERLVVGLMSGMSRDGLDLALVRLRGEGRRPEVELLAHAVEPYPAELRRRIREAATGRTRDVCTLGFALAERWAGDVLRFLEREAVAPRDVDLLASHGQTLDHLSREATLQVGDGDVLAERTGIRTVSDFRPRDIAAGGEGAPLVPYADWVLYAEADAVSACHNLGSIANVTVVTERLEDVIAFDTGPANALLDGIVRLRLGDEAAFDRDGGISAAGQAPRNVLETMESVARGWLSASPPKSAGYEDFGPPLARRVVEAHPGATTEDLARAAVHFTASTMRDAYARFVLPGHPRLERVRLSGGGAHNPTLVGAIRAELGRIGLRAVPLDDAWIDAKEAAAFAVLGDATARGVPSNVPGATGASHPVVLGKISR